MLPRTSPESMGLPSSAVLRLIDRLEAEGHEPHSLMILRNGAVLAEGWWTPYAPDPVHRLYSLSKSFTSTAAGLAIAEGLLSLDDLLDFFPELAPETPSENLGSMRVRDLLTMTCGQDSDDRSDMLAEPDGNWARAFLRRPVHYAPGSHFLYNSSATYMVSAILHRLSGQSLLNYLRPRLLDPLGIHLARWETDPQGICVGGWGLYVTTEAIARFGQCLIQKGHWEGRSVVPASWLEQATTAQVDNSTNSDPDWRQGYGFQFWQSRHGFRADGAFGQFCLVLPDREMVIAITSATNSLQGMLNAVWDELLPVLEPSSLAEDPASLERLRSRLASLAIPVPAGSPRSDVGDGIVTIKTGTKTLAIGTAAWVENESGIDPNVVGPATAYGAWQADGSFVARFQHLEATESSVATILPGRADYVTRGTWGPSTGTVTLSE